MERIDAGCRGLLSEVNNKGNVGKKSKCYKIHLVQTRGNSQHNMTTIEIPHVQLRWGQSLEHLQVRCFRCVYIT